MAAMLRRWRWPVALGAVLLAGLVFAFWPTAALVDTAGVSRGPMMVGVTDDGVTRAEEYFVVSAPVTGYLGRIELEPGDRVERGTLITRMAGLPSTPLDPRSQRELAAALTAASAEQAGLETSLAQARRDLARAEELATRGFLAQARLEEARTRVAVGQAQVERAQAERRRIAALLSRPGGPAANGAVDVRAPASGQVLSVITESEGALAQGTALMTIGDPSRIEAVVDLLSREAARVSAGDRVMITQWGGDEPIAGRVLRVEPFGRLKISALGIEEQRVNVIIGFDPAEAGKLARLGHGYQIDATIVLWEADRVLRVPIGALFRGADQGWRVFAVEDGRAVERVIRLGHINDEFGEVLDGLEEGDRVILNPAGSLEDGARVKPRA